MHLFTLHFNQRCLSHILTLFQIQSGTIEESVAFAPRVMWCIATGSSYQQDLKMSHLFNSIHLFIDGFYNCTIMVAIVRSILVNLRDKSHWWDRRINIDSAMESRFESGQSRGPIVPRCHAGFPSVIGNLVVGALLAGTWQRKLISKSSTCGRGQRPWVKT